MDLFHRSKTFLFPFISYYTSGGVRISITSNAGRNYLKKGTEELHFLSQMLPIQTKLLEFKAKTRNLEIF